MVGPGVLLLLTMLSPVCAWAQQSPPASSLLVQSEIDLKRAVQIAMEAFGGEVVKADEIVRDGQRLFQIRLVNKGRVRDVLVDALSGKIINP
ncbi:PepSY domain-containing protein [Marinobacterium litorale]|jgi:uncharacterized membrane protein YkoI|uniref:PepSY domain-containing protein n=1 Tax=Marinobacterium litorale TaxID=404770 RepID=UPI0003FE30AA|nr:PepSY domain-containing protein [Marinobacterium litorale]